MSRAGVLLACALLLALSGAQALAGDHYNLEEGIPTQLEDAYPTAFRNREAQGLIRYDQTESGRKDVVRLEPRLEVGPWRNAQVEVSAPFLVGTGDKTGSGNVRLGGLYNFNQDTIWVPALALAARVEFPTGRDARGTDFELKAIASKLIPNTSRMQRVHLNAAWLYNAAPGPEERRHRYLVAVGYTSRLGPDTTLVADFVREQERREEETSNVLELGLRRQLTPFTLVAAGVGAGIAGESPRFRATVGLQHSF